MGEIENFPKNIGRYEIKAQLGAGAMGCVYLAEDPRIKRKVAIKVVKLDSIRTEEDRREFLARFQREAEVSGLLNDPGIVAIYDVGDSEVGPFLAMEYVGGKPLDSHIKSGEPLPLKTRLAIAAGIASALDTAHAHGIVHRDVKPGNVMITPDMRPKLMDFGIAKKEDASLTQTGTFLGTPSYASPEQIREGTATARSDIFSFAVMVFELLSGGLPFPGTSINTILYRIVNEPPVDLDPPVVGMLADGWKRVFAKALAKNPEERHVSCSAFIRDLLDSTSDLDGSDRLHILGALRPGADPEPGATLAGPGLRSAAPGVPASQATLLAPRKKGTGARAAVVSGLAAVLAAGGFLLFRQGGARNLVLDTTPASATVSQDGKELGRTPLPLSLRPGASLKVERKGFQPVVFRFDGRDLAPRLDLAPVKSDEVLRTEPAGATVVLDAVRLPGVTPLTVKGWNQGQKHDLTFTKGDQVVAVTLLEGETPGSKVFALADASQPRKGAQPQTVDANAPGTLRFSGEYPVRVRLDGRDMGEVRPGGTLPVPPGSHRLELASPRVFLKESRAVTVHPGQGTPVALPGLASLTVESFPSSALVVIDGVTTQVESDGTGSITVAKGRHTVGIQGHPAASRTVDVQADTRLPKIKI